MPRKLKIELDVDTSKAKKKVEEAVGTPGATGATGAPSASGAGASVSTAAPAAVPAAERAARSIEKLGESAAGAQVNLRSAGKAFAGMAVGLATSYAASRMKEGAARTAVEYGGGILGGASAGAMFGPWGALVGAVGGAAATYLKRDEAQRAAAEDFRKYDDGFQENRLWNARMRGLTEVEPSAVGLPEEAAAKDRIAKLEAKIAEARAIELRQFDEENATVAKIRGHLKKGEVAAAATAEEELRVRRARREQVEGIRRAFEQEKKGVERAEAERSAKAAKAEDTRTDTTGTDALARAGAGWGAAAAPEAVRSPKSGIGLVVRKAAAEAAEAAGGPQFGGFSVASRKTAEFKFGGSDGESTSRSIKAANEILARQNEKMIAALQEIERNTKGGSAWQ